MHNHLSTLGLVILGCITLMGILVSQLFGLRESLTTNNLEDAIQSSLYAARDDSARIERGTFVVDKDKFEKNMGTHKLYTRKNGVRKAANYKFSYLSDDDTEIKDEGRFLPVKAVRVKTDADIGNNTNKKNPANDSRTLTYVVQTYGKDKKTDKGNDITR